MRCQSKLPSLARIPPRQDTARAAVALILELLCPDQRSGDAGLRIRFAGLTAVLAIGVAGCAGATGRSANEEPPEIMTTDTPFDLASMTGTTWVAEDINQRGVIDMLQSSLRIVSNDEVDGFAGCNSFKGKAVIDADTIRMGPLASTRKMCPPAIMNQEAEFLRALEAARSARVEKGLLYMMDEGGEAILRFWKREK